MCFYHDSGWCAAIHEETDFAAGPQGVCEDCGARIYVNEWRRVVYQQEHEDCTECGVYGRPGRIEAPADDEDLEPCDIGDHNFGETYSAMFCRGCCDLRQAIEAVEADAGCPPSARQPSYAGLWEELTEHDDLPKYLERATAMFPDLRERHKLTDSLFEWVDDHSEDDD